MLRGIGRGDVALASLLLINGQYEAWGPPSVTMAHVVGPRAVNAVGFAVAALALLWRRRLPLGVVTVVSAVVVVLSVSLGASQGLALFLPMLAALYAVGRYAPSRLQRTAGLAIGGAGVIIHDIFDPLVTEVDNILLTFWLILLAGWVIGDAFRRRHLRAQRDERARAMAAIAEERARIARDLHDIIAHGLGLVVLQAVAALEALDTSPDRARQPVRTIERTARQSLAEMRRLVTVMRESEPVEDRENRSLEDLRERLSAAQMPVTWELSGTADDLPPALQLTVCRIVQEAVTNASKHAPGANVQVVIAVTDSQVEIDVDNDPAPHPPDDAAPDPGYGLIGIRERVAVYGGSFEAEPTEGGGFSLQANIPLI